jgi:hypothetical protein
MTALYDGRLDDCLWAYADDPWGGIPLDALVFRMPLSNPELEWASQRRKIAVGGIAIFDWTVCHALKDAAYTLIRRRLASNLEMGRGYSIVTRRGCCGG